MRNMAIKSQEMVDDFDLESFAIDDLDLSALSVTVMRDATALPESGASSGSNWSCSCCATCSCCSSA